jgi:hypothetical protein
MNSYGQNDRERELQNREQELKDRELALRLRELEAEIHAKSQTKEIPIYPNPLSVPERKSLRLQFNQFLKWSKVIGGIILGLNNCMCRFVCWNMASLSCPAGWGWIHFLSTTVWEK